MLRDWKLWGWPRPFGPFPSVNNQNKKYNIIPSVTKIQTVARLVRGIWWSLSLSGRSGVRSSLTPKILGFMQTLGKSELRPVNTRLACFDQSNHNTSSTLITSPCTYGSFSRWHVSYLHHSGLTVDFYCLTLTFPLFSLFCLETLTSLNFFIQTRIYAPFAPLESSHWALKLDSIFIYIWRIWSGGKTESILDHSSPLEAFGPPKVGFSYRLSEDKVLSLFQSLSIMPYLDL